MKLPLRLTLCIILLVSCNSKFDQQIGHPNSTHDFFPFQEYDTVEMYAFNQDQSFKDSIKLEIKRMRLNYSPKELYDSTSLGKHFKLLQFINDYGEPSIVKDTISLSLADSGKKLKSLSKWQIRKLQKVFQLPKTLPEYIDDSLCMPKYREALVFKKKGKIIGWINICFECWQIEAYPRFYFLMLLDNWYDLEAFFAKKRPLPYLHK